MRTAIFYYGCELPASRAATTALRDAAVVLQAYHPLVATGQFADYFPHCSLYVYWNPTGVPADDLAGAGPGIALLAPDPVWNLARLDLRSAAARQFAARRGLLAAHWQIANLVYDEQPVGVDCAMHDLAIIVDPADDAEAQRHDQHDPDEAVGKIRP